VKGGQMGLTGREGQRLIYQFEVARAYGMF
jgi:hypothetical protein